MYRNIMLILLLRMFFMNVIFDATIIANYFDKNASRSGIFFAAKNILELFLADPQVQVLFYFSSKNIEHSIRVHEELYPDVPCVQSFEKYNRLISSKRKLQSLHKKLYARSLARKIPALGILLLNFVLQKTFEKDCQRDLIKKTDCFFSPIYKIPKIIRNNKNIRPFVCLYDAIPILFPNLSCASFAKDVCESTLTSDTIFYDSKNTQNDFERLFPYLKKNKKKVVYLAASGLFKEEHDKRRFRLVKEKYGIPHDKRYVFSLCSVAPHKNLVRNLRTFSSFIKKHKIDDLIWILGGGSLASFVDQLKQSGVDFDTINTRYIGYVDDEDLPTLYSNAEWFVYTSQYEGFGLPPLEAMQCGCPVITSNNSSLPEVVGDAGIMIDWDSDEQHIEAYEKYYFNEKLRKENSRKGLERAKLFSWKKTVDKIIETL